MRKDNIILKLKAAGLVGRGGAGFPTWKKWECVKKIHAPKKYVICNASEGEPGVFKDGFILQNYPDQIIKGIKLAMETIDATAGYIYLRHDYYKKFKKNLIKLIGKDPINLTQKEGHYLAGEESVLLNVIEKKERFEPRLKPPFPTEKGLYGYPTLINNVETFFYISEIADSIYQNTRFYSISGDIKHPGVYELPFCWTIEQVLNKTKNFPKKEFFVQAGGGAIGKILNFDNLNQPAHGAGAIIVYDKKKTDKLELMKKWARFFLEGNCDKCVPCREGIYRIYENLKTGKIDKNLFEDIFFVMEKTSFCALGRSASTAFKTLLELKS